MIHRQVVSLAEIEKLQPGSTKRREVQSMLGFPVRTEKNLSQEDWEYYFEFEEGDMVRLVQPRTSAYRIEHVMRLRFDKEGTLIDLERR